MLMLRKVLNLLRGQVTPFQVIAACVLGAAMGFMPGFAQAPGLLAALMLLLIVLNANLLLAALVGGVAAIASLLLMPVSFHLGRVLLDGPTQPIFKALINAPVLALFGFEYYATTGGLVLGSVLGAAAGVGVVALLRTFRVKMAALEEGGLRYQQWTGKKWVKVLTWVVAGGGPKQGYKALVEAKKRGQPVRPLGVVFAVGVVVLAGVVQLFASGPIVTAVLIAGLERTNGATVDLKRAEVSLREGRLVLEGLAMADPNALSTDLFRAARLEAELSVTDLLRKRLTLDRVVISDATSGEKRAVPGRRTAAVSPSVVESAPPSTGAGVQEKTIDDYLAEAELWKQRLAQVRRWLERLSGPGDEPTTVEERETLLDRLTRQIAEVGYAHVQAGHLIDGAATLLVRELLAEHVRVQQLDGETLDIHGQNLSTHPHLVDATPRVTLRSSAGTLLADVSLGEAAAGSGAGDNQIALEFKGLSGDAIGEALAISGTPPIHGGTVDLVSQGTWQAGQVDLLLNVTARDATLSMAGASEAGAKRVSRFDLPLRVRGPLDRPAVLLDDEALADALVKAGAQELANRVRGEADRAIHRAAEDVSNRIGQEAGGLIRGLIPVRTKDGNE